MGTRSGRKAGPWIYGTAAGLATLAGGAKLNAIPVASFPALERAAIFPEFFCHYENVLGTSMDMIVQAPSQRDAAECERHVLAEIDRLSSILSTYDPASEISRVSNGSPIESSELTEMLGLYDAWGLRTDGAISANLAEVKRLWSQGQRDNRMPEMSALQQAFCRHRALNVDALGKGFIIDRAVAVARRLAPAGLLNIGGDIRAWGDQAWRIGIADPFDPADNAAPLAVFTLHNAAVASSGGYARFFTIDGKTYSHIIDPRTLAPVDDIHRCSTVVASDCVTANALSTAMCVLDVASGQPMVDRYGTGHLTVQAGEIHRGGSFANVRLTSRLANPTPVLRYSEEPDRPSNNPALRTTSETASPARTLVGQSLAIEISSSPVPVNSSGAVPLAATTRWPAGYRVKINFKLILPTDRVKHPYVVVWIETEEGKPVRNITLWGNQDRYLPHLSTWWNLIHMNLKGAKSMAAATRPAGKYTLYWDGRNDAGTMMPQGKYNVHIEISREHGTHAEQIGLINCGAGADSGHRGSHRRIRSGKSGIQAARREVTMQINRSFLAFCRTIHIYLTMLGLFAMLGFGVTGFTAYHETWFDAAKTKETEWAGKIPTELLEKKARWKSSSTSARPSPSAAR